MSPTIRPPGKASNGRVRSLSSNGSGALLVVAALFVAYATQPLLVEKMTNFPVWIVRRNPHLKLAMSRIANSFPIHWLFLLAAPLGVALALIALPIFGVLVIAPLAAGVFVISLKRVFPLPPYLFYFLLFLSFETLLVAWGFDQAMDRCRHQRDVVIASEKLNVRGSLIFLGSGHVALFDKDNNVLDVNVEKTAPINLGKFEPANVRCLEYQYLEKIRNYLGLKCEELGS